jgi:RNA polymerase sigma factor (sigma-70 family)
LDTDLTFEQVVRDHQDMVFRTLLRLTGSREHLDDLAQDVFLRLYRALPSFRGEALITTYLYRIAVNVAQDEWKRRRRDRDTLVSISEEREFQQSVEEQLQRLSQVERTILVLYHQEERSYEQIGYALGMPIGTVRTHLHRGRKKLREALQQRQTPERRATCTTNR